MAQPIIIIGDPGIDGAFAIALAMQDPDLEVVGLAATPGNIDAQQATKNVHIILDQIDPRRWPRLGAAPAVEYEQDGISLHGPGGLGGVNFPVAELHHPPASDKLVVELARQYPREVTIVCLGPLTVLAQALDRDPELPKLAKRIICLGGAWHEPGNASAVAEFHFYLRSARRPPGAALRQQPDADPPGHDAQGAVLAVGPAGAAGAGITHLPFSAADHPGRHPAPRRTATASRAST